MEPVDLLSRMAVSGVATQQRLNDGYSELDQLLGVPRMRVSTFRFESRLRVAKGKSTAFSIAVKPVDIGFQIRHSIRNETLSRFAVTIEQVSLAQPERQER